MFTYFWSRTINTLLINPAEDTLKRFLALSSGRSVVWAGEPSSSFYSDLPPSGGQFGDKQSRTFHRRQLKVAVCHREWTKPLDSHTQVTDCFGNIIRKSLIMLSMVIQIYYWSLPEKYFTLIVCLLFMAFTSFFHEQIMKVNIKSQKHEWKGRERRTSYIICPFTRTFKKKNNYKKKKKKLQVNMALKHFTDYNSLNTLKEKDFKIIVQTAKFS